MFFCNSGTEANEAAIKLARKCGLSPRRTRAHDDPGVQRLVSRPDASARSPPPTTRRIAKASGRCRPAFAFTPFNDARRAAKRDRRSHRGVYRRAGARRERRASRRRESFCAAARRLCDERGALLIFDEIQCGMGRTGTLFAFEQFGIRPDIVTMAKSLANGLPIGALLGQRSGRAAALRRAITARPSAVPRSRAPQRSHICVFATNSISTRT